MKKWTARAETAWVSECCVVAADTLASTQFTLAKRKYVYVVVCNTFYVLRHESEIYPL